MMPRAMLWAVGAPKGGWAHRSREQHVNDDLGWVPTVKDWLQHLDVQPWMGRTLYRPSADTGGERERDTSEPPNSPLQADKEQRPPHAE